MKDESSLAPAPSRPLLVYPFDTKPELGQTLEVAPGVLWIRMALPFVLNHINLWAIEDGEGWAIVDTGVQSAETTTAWREIFANGLRKRPVTRVIATHMHPDHVGMAGWITRRFGCRLWMTRGEYLTCRVLVADTGREAPAEAIEFYKRAGWGEDAIEFYRTRFGGFGKHVYALPDSFRRLHDEETVQIGRYGWRIVVGTGHSPEHACLYCPELKLLISGDQVLPRISSNVSVFPTEPDADPLGDWFASLTKLGQAIPDDVLVLPAHNEPFRGLHARLQHLRAGHDHALARLGQMLSTPRRAIDVFGALFARPIDREDQNLAAMATGESLAHLNRLLRGGAVKMDRDADGVSWYTNLT